MCEQNILSYTTINMIRKNRGKYILPEIEEDGTSVHDGMHVRLLLTCNGMFNVQSPQFPIRCKKTYGNYVQFFQGEGYDNQNYACFIFDSVMKVWNLIYEGYLCFNEQEIGLKHMRTHETD